MSAGTSAIILNLMQLGHDPSGLGGESVEDFDSFTRHRQQTDVVLGIRSRLALTHKIHRILDRIERRKIIDTLDSHTSKCR